MLQKHTPHNSRPHRKELPQSCRGHNEEVVFPSSPLMGGDEGDQDHSEERKRPSRYKSHG